MKEFALREFELAPTPEDGRLTEQVGGIDQNGAPVDTRVVVEIGRAHV